MKSVGIILRKSLSLKANIRESISFFQIIFTDYLLSREIWYLLYGSWQPGRKDNKQTISKEV